MKARNIIMLIVLLTIVSACREEDVIFIPERVNVATPEYIDLEGFYLLNEGNMGTNKSSLDYFSFNDGEYYTNIYEDANPDVVKDLGDVGNDLQIYGNRLYAVINCSNKVEVMDAHTCRRIGQVDIPNCRYIKFHGKYAYVTSYAGEVKIDPNYEQTGYVAKVDTATLEIVARCEVGFQPDGLEIIDEKIYVANSGGYMVPNYENTISVIDIETFKEEERVPIAINLYKVVGDERGMLWISSRGDYRDVMSDIYVYDVRKKRIVKRMDVRMGNWWKDDDKLYVISSQWSEYLKDYDISYAVIDMVTMEKLTSNFITDGTDELIMQPYGVAINPITKDRYVTDARTFVNPGYLYCFGTDGKRKWRVMTGDIPAHFAFLGK